MSSKIGEATKWDVESQSEDLSHVFALLQTSDNDTQSVEIQKRGSDHDSKSFHLVTMRRALIKSMLVKL
jgi:hypothetical protein